MSRRVAAALGIGGVAAIAACGAEDPCHTSRARRVHGYSMPYAGEWVVARGDTVTLPQGFGDRFRLAGFRLDSTAVVIDGACRYRGALLFAQPRAETLAVTWFGEPEQAYVYGWPAELGPFGGLGLSFWGRDSLRGALLFDERMGVRMEPGVTAEFVAGRS